MNGELLSLIDMIVRDKGIDREVLIQAIESAMTSAAKKGVTKEDEEVTVTIDRAKGDIVVTSNGKTLSSAEFSRIGAQTAKQVIMQKIREAERDVILGEFQHKVGAIVSGTVHRFERGDIIVDLGRTEAILPKAERIPYEDYRQGECVQAYVLEVRKGLRGAEIVLSRAREGLIHGLFALEVPEIADGTVEIRAIAREPGDRTKIAVSSKDEKVDCVGACVGVRGTRVKNIVRELHGERVDIIRWHDDVTSYIAAALAPAQILEIRPDAKAKHALVVVADDQLSLAIGKKGQNVRLASKLTGWQLDIKSQSQLGAAAIALRDAQGVGPSMEKRLTTSGVSTVEQLASATLEQLSAIKGIGEKTAEKLIQAAKRALAKAQEPPAPPARPSLEPERAADVTPEASAPPQAQPPPPAEPSELPSSEPPSDESSDTEPSDQQE